MLTSKVPVRRIYLPHESDTSAWVECRYLSHTALERARKASRSDSLQVVKEMGAEMIQATIARADPGEVAEKRAANNADPLAGYDRRTLLREAITGWSYDEPVTPDGIDDLDEETVEFLAEQLIPRKRTDEDRGNGSSGSTSHLTVVGAD